MQGNHYHPCRLLGHNLSLFASLNVRESPQICCDHIESQTMMPELDSCPKRLQAFYSLC